jgi:UDP-N-acetylglucosamine 1-carboxyvinyltransferase
VQNYNKESFYGVEAKGLTTDMLLDEASVTGTVMAAVLAKGKTTVYNAACEPYLQQLCKVNSMGANITGVGSNLLVIEGVKILADVSIGFTR